VRPGQKIAGVGIHRSGELQEEVEAGLPTSVLDEADLRSVHSESEPDLFLTES